MMVVNADVNAKRQAGGDENRRTLPPRAPGPLRTPRESKMEKIPQTKKHENRTSNLSPGTLCVFVCIK